MPTVFQAEDVPRTMVTWLRTTATAKLPSANMVIADLRREKILKEKRRKGVKDRKGRIEESTPTYPTAL